MVTLRPYGGPVDVLFDVTGKLLLQSGRLTRLAPLAAHAGRWAGRLTRDRFRGAERSIPLGYLLVARRTAAGTGSSRNLSASAT